MPSRFSPQDWILIDNESYNDVLGRVIVDQGFIIIFDGLVRSSGKFIPNMRVFNLGINIHRYEPTEEEKIQWMEASLLS